MHNRRLIAARRARSILCPPVSRGARARLACSARRAWSLVHSDPSLTQPRHPSYTRRLPSPTPEPPPIGPPRSAICTDPLPRVAHESENVPPRLRVTPARRSPWTQPTSRPTASRRCAARPPPPLVATTARTAILSTTPTTEVTMVRVCSPLPAPSPQLPAPSLCARRLCAALLRALADRFHRSICSRTWPSPSAFLCVFC